MRLRLTGCNERKSLAEFNPAFYIASIGLKQKGRERYNF